MTHIFNKHKVLRAYSNLGKGNRKTNRNYTDLLSFLKFEKTMYEELQLIQKLSVDNFQRYRVRFHIDLEVIVIIKFGPNIAEKTERT